MSLRPFIALLLKRTESLAIQKSHPLHSEPPFGSFGRDRSFAVEERGSALRLVPLYSRTVLRYTDDDTLKEAQQKNAVIKGVIDRLRQLQGSLDVLKATPPTLLSPAKERRISSDPKAGLSLDPTQRELARVGQPRKKGSRGPFFHLQGRGLQGAKKYLL